MSEIVVQDPGNSAPSFTLHPLKGILAATFCGTPVAAGIIMAINYWRIGRKSAARNAVVISAVATLAMFAIIFAIPEETLNRVPNAVFLVPQLLVVHLIAKRLQNDFIVAHQEQGGPIASVWPSVGIGLLCLPFAVAAIFGAAVLLDSAASFGTVVKFGNDEIYYAEGATEEDTRKLARVLTETGYFGSTGTSVRLTAPAGKYAVSFVLMRNVWNDRKTVDLFRQIGEAIAASAFPPPLTVHLCDDAFAIKETIAIAGVPNHK